MKKRIVVTGFGCVTPIGLSSDEYWRNSLRGSSGIQRIKNIGGLDIPDNMSQVVGCIKEYKECENPFIKYLGYDRSTQFALHSVSEAMQIAKLDEKENKDISVVLATAIGNIGTMEKSIQEWTDEDGDILLKNRDISKYPKSVFQFNNVADVISEKYNLRGEKTVIATGCTGGLDAIGYSLNSIRRGDVEIIITGSTEAPITPLVVASFSKIGATTTDNENPNTACRPFDKYRSGFVLAEGCGIVILESLEHAISRNAPIWAEVVGYGSCNNAKHMTDIPINGDDICKSMQLALKDAEINSNEIQYINLHGSSTQQNDSAERNAMRTLFHDRYSKIFVTSNKSQIGHALSASNSIETISCIKSLVTGIIPPTNNYKNIDEFCDLNVVKKPMKIDGLNYIIKNSSGFSGIHSSIVLKKVKEEVNV